MKNYFVYSLLCLIFLSCNNFLDEQPSKTSNLEISTIEHLDALLGNYTMFYEEMNSPAILGTDDYALDVETYLGTGTFFSYSNVQFAVWDQKYLPSNNIDDYFWSSEYSKIFYANLILSNLSNVSGSEEEKVNLRAEAYLIRAYSFFVLANTYALPYTEETKDELGITLKQTNSFDENIGRATLQETYEQIESDLQEALKAQNPIIVNGVHRPWRGNMSAAKAFAARYYLHRGDYKLAQEYASQALADYNALVDYNTEMNYYETTYEFDDQDGSGEIVLPDTWNSRDEIRWKEFYYTRFTYISTGWYIPSESLLNIYNKDYDLRYKYHVVENFSKYWNSEYGLFPGYVFYGMYHIPSGPTVAEMLLILAEAQARQGQWEEGMNTLNILREKRIDNSIDYRLSATSQEDAIKKILEERRRELPFSARWYDIRRLNNNEDPNDDIELEKTFYPLSATAILEGEEPITYSISKDSRRWASPLPQDEIISGQGKIIQNEY